MQKRILTPVFLALLVASCDGGSPLGPSQDDGEDANGELAGSIVSAYTQNNVERVDLQSGYFERLPFDHVQRMIETDSDLDPESDLSFVTTSDQTQNAAFVQSYLECIEPDPDYVAIYDNNLCYSVYGSDLTHIATHWLNQDIDAPLKLSRSQGYVLVNDYRRVFNTANDIDIHLSVRDVVTNGVLYTIKIPTGFGLFNDARLGETATEWGLNDEVIYTDARDQPPAIYITEPLSTEVARKIRMPEMFRGTIQDMHLSPDGTRLLLSYLRDDGGAAGKAGFPIILDLDTLALHYPALHQFDTDELPLNDQGLGYLQASGWSPDGQWILLKNAEIRVVTPNTFDFTTDYELLAVPADGVNQVISHDSALAAPDIVWLKVRNSDGGLVQLKNKNVRYTWLEN